jgi:hypothetical protein
MILSLPREVRLVAPCRVIKIRIKFISHSKEWPVHMLKRIIRKLSRSRAISNIMIRTIAI